ncbi:hypothetical protein F2Q70_00029036 [Brassica cretica]|uniref:Uncharacterized protein n=1 Tax=Brassica cretica TaxID=69181 RepID=A0A8S9FH06_BRACR|nr:hypothetical protein F2Q70_00029036 [Brassica cretica]
MPFNSYKRDLELSDVAGFASTDALLFDCSDSTISIDVQEIRSKRRFDETSSSTNPQRPPWPRTENTPFDVSGYDDSRAAINSNECRHRPLSDKWDDFDGLFYNAWLGVSIEPTKFLDRRILKKLGIERDVKDMITQLGLGTMPSRAYDRVVEVTYRTSSARVAGDELRLLHDLTISAP